MTTGDNSKLNPHVPVLLLCNMVIPNKLAALMTQPSNIAMAMCIFSP